MLDITDFNVLFAFDPKFSFSNNSQSQIAVNRQSLGGQLFFDRLLEVLKVKCTLRLALTTKFASKNDSNAQNTGKTYPPTSNKDLRELHKSIIETSIATHHKLSLLYYILLDCSIHSTSPSRSRRGANERQASVASTTAAENAADAFARQTHLSQKYTFAIQGLWNMDRTQFKPALDYLCQPSLLPTFPEAVLHVLMANGRYNLAVAYVGTLGSAFNVAALDDVFASYFRSVADAGIATAYAFLQEQAVPDKKGLFEVMVESALSTPITAGKGGSAARVERCAQLIDLPFSEKEERWFEDFLVKGEGRSLQGAKQTVAMRWIAIGAIGDAAEVMEGLKENVKIDEDTKLTWPDIIDGLNQGRGEAGRVEELWYDSSAAN